jgi:hypothetical protein
VQVFRGRDGDLFLPIICQFQAKTYQKVTDFYCICEMNNADSISTAITVLRKRKIGQSSKAKVTVKTECLIVLPSWEGCACL